ncbi:MAG: 8-oxo-dGTP diphosphatase [Clostridia bacterium]|nr:8-oxo-dGTP diphosphatase [Clostridia bacterium]
MKNTTLCYIEKDGAYLMLHKASRKNDGNDGKWLGVGGHFEEKESPFDCVTREVYEETGLTLIKPKYRGLVTFVSDKYETELMHLFTCTEFTGELSSCPEGELCWVDKAKVRELPMWEGDKVFLDLLDTEQEFFTLKLTYKGDRLVGAEHRI